MIVFDDRALDDLERILEFNLQRDPAAARDHVDKIRSAVLILDDHPEIGRPIGGGSTLRELIISHGRTGYVALYAHAPVENLVRIVVIRHQHEAGYAAP